VLVLHRGLTQRRAQGPAIVHFFDMVSAQRQERLDREDQAFGDLPAVVLLVPGRDFRRLVMQRTPDAVARQIADEAVAVLTCDLPPGFRTND